ncbi:MAG: hypothetical protein KBA31_13040 [Alphaproteobacteria bacterium]|nr:hypothetical protein [Alphaproteobacteria bacterium]
MADLKAKGRSAPAGRLWHEFFKKVTKGIDRSERPALPLILAGSVASNAQKQDRLREHLFWADKHGRLEEAFALLFSTPEDGWNEGSESDWHKSSSWEDGE